MEKNNAQHGKKEENKKKANNEEKIETWEYKLTGWLTDWLAKAILNDSISD
jgi:hypothetical protein